MDDSPIHEDKEETHQSIIKRTCRCGDVAPIWTAWSDENPGRRFTGCPNYKDPMKNCHYFAWIDPELLSEASKRIILAKYLRSKIEILEAKMKMLSNEMGQSKLDLREMTEKVENVKAKYARLKDYNQGLKIEINKRIEREKCYIVVIAMLVVVLAVVLAFRNSIRHNGSIRFLKP